MKTAIYPGTFDPITNGHLDVLARACRLFDRVVVAIAEMNSDKDVTFSVQERIGLVEENLGDFRTASVVSFDCLLVDLVVELNAQVIVRGLRAVSDFEYEFQMAQMNRHLDADIETIFLMPSEKYFYTSSKLIKQVHLGGVRETELVPQNVLEALRCLRETGSIGESSE